MAARSTSPISTGADLARRCLVPARMSRLSPLRRMRAARWSSRKRFSSRRGSFSSYSIASMRLS
ncbi:Uncharacterised protein [Mycobacteroides abscessus subsp. abscessus]|nr:Uncharacterised protein [Mycobacteroides abscessus subsp. abscessus]